MTTRLTQSINVYESEKESRPIQVSVYQHFVSDIEHVIVSNVAVALTIDEALYLIAELSETISKLNK